MPIEDALWAAFAGYPIARIAWRHKWSVRWDRQKNLFRTNGSYHFLQPGDQTENDWYVVKN